MMLKYASTIKTFIFYSLEEEIISSENLLLSENPEITKLTGSVLEVYCWLAFKLKFQFLRQFDEVERA